MHLEKLNSSDIGGSHSKDDDYEETDSLQRKFHEFIQMLVSKKVGRVGVREVLSVGTRLRYCVQEGVTAGSFTRCFF